MEGDKFVFFAHWTYSNGASTAFTSSIRRQRSRHCILSEYIAPCFGLQVLCPEVDNARQAGLFSSSPNIALSKRTLSLRADILAALLSLRIFHLSIQVREGENLPAFGASLEYTEPFIFRIISSVKFCKVSGTFAS